METYLITESAWETMASVVRATQGRFETGGLLIGPRSQPVIVAATKPGPKAEHLPFRFTDDPNHQQAEFDSAASEFRDKVRWRGTYHLHPGVLSRPSHGDLNQAREFLEHLGGRVLVVIAVLNGRAFEPDCPVALRGFELQTGDRSFREVELMRVPDDSPAVAEALAQEPETIPVNSSDMWADPGFLSYLTPSGRARINAEVAELREAGFRVTTLRRKGDHRLLIHLDSFWGRLLCTPPREYPLNPPSLYLGRRTRPIPPLTRALAWNSDRRMCDLVKEALTVLRRHCPVSDALLLMAHRIAWPLRRVFVRRHYHLPRRHGWPNLGGLVCGATTEDGSIVRKERMS